MAKAMYDASHATPHCISTTPTVLMREPSSRRMVATAATQGVYSSVNTRKLTALRVVNRDVMAVLPSSTSRVLTTDSLAIKPEISAVAHRQSPKPSGLNSTASHCPISASRLSALSVTTLSRVSKLCRNQITTVARKITVNARCKKSLAFSHSSSPTLLRDGSR